MKGKQLLIVLLLLLALGAAALVLSRRNAATWSNNASSTTTNLLNFSLNDVSQVTLKSAGEEVSLTRKEEIWTVTERADYPADFEKVSGLLRKLWELRSVQDVKIGPSQLARLQLGDASAGTLIDLKDAGGKRLAALQVGKTYLRESDQMPGPAGGIPVGRYVMAQDGSNRVFVVSQTLDEVQNKTAQWLAPDFVKIEAPKLIAVTSFTPGVNWTLARDGATTPWKLADAKPGEEFDPTKITGITNAFANATFSDVLPPGAPVAETGLDQSSSVRVETFDNFVYELRIGKLSGENYPVLVSVKANLPHERSAPPDEKPEDKARLDGEFQTRMKQLGDKLAAEQTLPARPFLITKSTIEQLLKDRSALMAEKQPSPSPAASVSPAKPAVTAPVKAPSPSPRKR